MFYELNRIRNRSKTEMNLDLTKNSALENVAVLRVFEL